MKDEGSQRQGVYYVLSLIRAYYKDSPEEIHTLLQTLEAQVRELRPAETAIKVRRYILNLLCF